MQSINISDNDVFTCPSSLAKAQPFNEPFHSCDTIVHKCFNDIDDPWLNMYLHNECNE